MAAFILSGVGGLSDDPTAAFQLYDAGFSSCVSYPGLLD